jgi:hypothetical protein
MAPLDGSRQSSAHATIDGMESGCAGEGACVAGESVGRFSGAGPDSHPRSFFSRGGLELPADVGLVVELTAGVLSVVVAVGGGHASFLLEKLVASVGAMWWRLVRSLWAARSSSLVSCSPP